MNLYIVFFVCFKNLEEWGRYVILFICVSLFMWCRKKKLIVIKIKNKFNNVKLVLFDYCEYNYF